jgi:hypothetical protein
VRQMLSVCHRDKKTANNVPADIRAGIRLLRRYARNPEMDARYPAVNSRASNWPGDYNSLELADLGPIVVDLSSEE